MSIQICALTKRFEQHVIFDRFNIEIPYKQTTVITGGSGCGKTTLLRMIAGLDHRYRGKISGVPQRISFMFQENRLLPWFTMRQNIEFVLKDMMQKSHMDQVVQRMIDAVQLTGHENKYPNELSGGMKRRVSMARAYSCPSELLLMDEPFKELDAALKKDMLALFGRLIAQQNKTAVIVSHDEMVVNSLDCNILKLG